MLIATILVIIIGLLVWIFGARRGDEADVQLVYVNQDGSVRELSPKELAYTSAKYEGFDSGRPYIKSHYNSFDGWNSKSGFMERRRVPADIAILPVNPDFDTLEAEMGHEHDRHAIHRAAGDIIEELPDGSISLTPNPNIPNTERFEIMRQYHLAEQRQREALAKISDSDA